MLPVPVPNDVIVVPAVTPVPEMTFPAARGLLPIVTAETVIIKAVMVLLLRDELVLRL